jgi:hypothetical protein
VQQTTLQGKFRIVLEPYLDPEVAGCLIRQLVLLLQVAFAREYSSEASHNGQAHSAAEQLALKVRSLSFHQMLHVCQQPVAAAAHQASGQQC